MSKLPLAAGSVKWANRDRQKAEGLGWCELSQTEEGVWKGTPLHGWGGGLMELGAGEGRVLGPLRWLQILNV